MRLHLFKNGDPLVRTHSCRRLVLATHGSCLGLFGPKTSLFSSVQIKEKENIADEDASYFGRSSCTYPESFTISGHSRAAGTAYSCLPNLVHIVSLQEFAESFWRSHVLRKATLSPGRNQFVEALEAQICALNKMVCRLCRNTQQL